MHTLNKLLAWPWLHLPLHSQKFSWPLFLSSHLGWQLSFLSHYHRGKSFFVPLSWALCFPLWFTHLFLFFVIWRTSFASFLGRGSWEYTFETSFFSFKLQRNLGWLQSAILEGLFINNLKPLLPYFLIHGCCVWVPPVVGTILFLHLVFSLTLSLSSKSWKHLAFILGLEGDNCINSNLVLRRKLQCQIISETLRYSIVEN